MNPPPDWASKYRNDPRSTDELLHLGLTKDMDEDDEEYWQPIRSLQYRLPTIAEQIETMLRSSDPKSRDTAATILGQSSVEEKWEAPHCAEKLVAALKLEKSADALISIIFALGHLHHAPSIEAILPLGKHPDPNVRYAVVQSLSGYEIPEANAALIELSSDPDHDVRNWATFGLGSQIETDTPAIRQALLNRLGEQDSEIRGEALVGLADRGDTRLVSPFLRELTRIDRDPVLVAEAADAIIRAACNTGASNWLPVLEKLSALHLEEIPLQEAIVRCTSHPT